MTIKTARLVLRPLGLQDLDTTHEYASDPLNTKYMLHLPNKTKDDTAQFLKNVEKMWEQSMPRYYEFAVMLNGQHIGATSVVLNESRQTGWMGWVINKAYWGKGYATEAAKAVLKFAVNELGVEKIGATCDYRNESSVKVMKKIGLKLECSDGMRRYEDSDEDIQELVYFITAGELCLPLQNVGRDEK